MRLTMQFKIKVSGVKEIWNGPLDWGFLRIGCLGFNLFLFNYI